MTTFLKELFLALVEKTQDIYWYNEYKKLVEEVSLRIRSGTPLSAQNDYELLKTLIYRPSNGIASIPLAMLSEDNFKKLINDNSFMEDVNSYVANPNSDSYWKLYQTWQTISEKNNFNFVKSKANRFMAAFCPDVSTTADEGKFNEVYAWFERHGLFRGTELIGNENWFTRNQRLVSVLRQEFANENNHEIDVYWQNMFVWFLWERLITNPYRLKKQVVKYGPPGTGKTFTALRDAAREIAIWKSEFHVSQNYTVDELCETIQFHPTFGYEDFIEGLRPTKVERELASGAKEETYPLRLHNGVFKEFCRKAGRWEIDIYKAGMMPDRSTKEGRETVSPVDSPISNLLQYKEKLSGAHWDYIFGLISQYGNRPLRDVLPPYFLIIDEINRAELSRVFGELMYCLEYRGCDGKVATQYSELNSENDALLMTPVGARFFIPTNVYIIGTMNTIDRSVESFDFALRRRFFWQHVIPDENVARAYLTSDRCPNKSWIDILDHWNALNRKIANEKRFMGPDYCIGHAYLMNLKYSGEISSKAVRTALWEDTIGPLVEEYLRGTDEDVDAFKKAFDA